ncbi:NAD(P)-dependent oxidoreductase [Gammaproteobacteria bacterium]
MMHQSAKRRILITGAAGRIGQILARAWANVYDLVLVDVRPAQNASVPILQIDAAESDVMRNLCQDVDTVIPLAISGNMHDNWNALIPVNLTATQTAYLAASEQGCRRIIFPSSIQIGLNPNSPYTRSKTWGEKLGRRYAKRTSLSVICLRLGRVLPADAPGIIPGTWFLDHVLTYGDLVRLFTASVEAPDEFRYGIFWGLSANTFNRFDISETCRVLGYQPQDNAFLLAEQTAKSWHGRWRMEKSIWKKRLEKWLNY